MQYGYTTGVAARDYTITDAVPVNAVGNRVGQMSVVMDRQRSILNALNDLAKRLHSLCDTLQGPLPTPAQGHAIQHPEPMGLLGQGLLGQIMDSLNAMDAATAWLASAVDRIESL